MLYCLWSSQIILVTASWTLTQFWCWEIGNSQQQEIKRSNQLTLVLLAAPGCWRNNRPPLTMRFTARQLKQCGEDNENGNLPKLSSRTQSLEIYVKLVTWVSDLVYGQEVRHRHCNATDLTISWDPQLIPSSYKFNAMEPYLDKLLQKKNNDNKK